MPQKLTQADVIKQFRAVHGRTYDYSEVVYAGAHTRVTIICRFHGRFQVTPGHHKNGVACRHCYFETNRLGLAQFIKRAKVAHPNRMHDYSKLSPQFVLAEKVRIRCLTHDVEFDQQAGTHLAGHTGCKCCLSEKLSGPAGSTGTFRTMEAMTSSFAARARETHGNRYRYDNAIYRGASKKVTILCPEHGAFEQTPSNHIKGTGCPACARTLPYRDSLKTKCRAAGLDYHRALKRQQAGMSEERIFRTGCVRGDREVRAITIHGRRYPNMEAAARALKPPASSHTISRWITEGSSPEEAFERVPNPGYANGSIYLITHLASGKKYVGLTIVPLADRWRGHCEQAAMNTIQSARSLHSAIREHGHEAFEIKQIDSGTTKAGLESQERAWIRKLNTVVPNGYNISLGGGSGGAHGREVKVDGIRFKSVRAAAEHLAVTRGISFEAAKGRLRTGRLDVRSPSKPGEAITKSRAYTVWSRIVHGVLNPMSKAHIPGIKLHAPWRDFRKFLADVGQPPEADVVFGRLDKSQDFTPNNCRWMPRQEAARSSAESQRRRPAK
jgi:GIY-YIG catalytic domain